VNPRNMKAHIQKLHKNETYIPSALANSHQQSEEDAYGTYNSNNNNSYMTLDETTGIVIEVKSERKKYVRKTGKFECDLCGRYFTTIRSLKIHMTLHTSRFIDDVKATIFTSFFHFLF